jgi:GT2 family glycosyltransferase
VIVVDDGSTDGTGEAVHEHFPKVTVLRGDGQLWWTGAIVLGMKEAIARGTELIVWLNDDCHPRPGTVEAVAAHAAATGEIASAETLSVGGGRYTGYVKNWRGLRPIPEDGAKIAACDACNGNCVAIPRTVVDRIGYPDARHFPHVFGDSDYGLTAARHGVRTVILREVICDDRYVENAATESWLFGERTLWQHLKSMRSVKSYFYLPAYWAYCTKHWGLWGVALFLRPYFWLFLCKTIRAVIPQRWLIRWAADRSLEFRKQRSLNQPS